MAGTALRKRTRLDPQARRRQILDAAACLILIGKQRVTALLRALKHGGKYLQSLKLNFIMN